jgi:hypothetical protein
MQDGFALDERIDRLLQARVRLEQELAGFELPLLTVQIGVELEQERLVDDALALEEVLRGMATTLSADRGPGSLTRRST